MKKMMIILGFVLAVSLSQAATLNWGSGTTVMKRELPSTLNLTGVLVELYFGTIESGTLMDSTLTSTAAGFKGTFSDSVAYSAATYGAGTTFYYVVYDTADSSGQKMYITAGGDPTGVNNLDSPTYFTTTAVVDTDSQTVNMSSNGFADTQDFQPVPEPTTMALVALGIAAIGLRRKM